MFVWKKYGDLKHGDLYRTEHEGYLYSRSGYALPNETLVIVDEPLPIYVPDGVYNVPWKTKDGKVVDSAEWQVIGDEFTDEVDSLLAAAPDLYNVVKNVEVHLSSLALEEDDSVSSQILALARQAIAKAEGKKTEEVAAEAKPDAKEAKPKKSKTEYQVVSAYGTENIGICVSTWVDDGWVPLGGVSVSYDSDCKAFVFAQAMTKTTE